MDIDIITTTHNNLLKARHINKVKKVVKTLEFVLVPAEISFGNVIIPTTNEIIKRKASSWEISIKDTRGSGSKWKVKASIKNPLTASDGSTLLNRLVYIKDGVEKPLTNSPIEVFSGVTGEESIIDLGWNKNEGILISLRSGDGVPHMTYTTTINWSLEDAP